LREGWWWREGEKERERKRNEIKKSHFFFKFLKGLQPLNFSPFFYFISSAVVSLTVQSVLLVGFECERRREREGRKEGTKRC
jgi:hypothetical protein